MRLLLLITDLELGGTPTVVRELATRLAPFVEHIEVVCLKPMGPVGEQLRRRGFDVTSLNALRLTDLNRATTELLAIVRERRIETVFSFLIHANFLAARAGKRLPGVRFLQSIQTTQPRPRWHWWLQRRVHRSAERIIVPSESVARRAVEWSGVPREKLIVIPNAIDVQTFARIVHVPASVPRVGFVGRLDPVKRVGDLLTAMTHLPTEVSLSIYGDGGERASIARAIATTPSFAGRVTLHGAIADPREAYANIDLLVLPSEAEGFGLVLIEAMAAGVPVVATNVDGIRDVVRDGETGLLVPVNDPISLARAIQRVIEDSSLRDTLVANARRDVEQRFAWDAVIDRYRVLLASTSRAFPV